MSPPWSLKPPAAFPGMHNIAAAGLTGIVLLAVSSSDLRANIPLGPGLISAHLPGFHRRYRAETWHRTCSSDCPWATTARNDVKFSGSLFASLGGVQNSSALPRTTRGGRAHNTVNAIVVAPGRPPEPVQERRHGRRTRGCGSGPRAH
ncbi:hypothetical protein GQ53DRAFT_113781 [Thozetella sp. PMI_491]|nr:hypothetical protein GQ53DRAFT_113781 [Thozetella sp. PMI_491]